MGLSSLITFKITLENLLIIIILLICEMFLHMIGIKIFDRYVVNYLSFVFWVCSPCSVFLLEVFIDFSDQVTQISSTLTTLTTVASPGPGPPQPPDLWLPHLFTYFLTIQSPLSYPQPSCLTAGFGQAWPNPTRWGTMNSWPPGFVRDCPAVPQGFPLSSLSRSAQHLFQTFFMLLSSPPTHTRFLSQREIAQLIVLYICTHFFPFPHLTLK